VLYYFLNSENTPQDTNLQKEINSCKEQLPDKGRYSILLPLIQKDGNWIGNALDLNGKQINYIYDTNLGFRKL
jgi:CRISPR-associated endonuclease/helicase Cas3